MNQLAPASTAQSHQALRPASQVMKLARMGQGFPHKLSFSRQIIRRMIADDCQVMRPVWQMCELGYGTAVYTLTLGGHRYSLVAISSPLDDALRSDRVIAEQWDACFTLFDGEPTAEDLDRLVQNQPRQEAGRYSARELTLSRANKSVRLFNHVRDCLAQGEQPDGQELNSVGYLMRTTAVYGNGKFGIADRFEYQERAGMNAPFQAEMLTVWLIREFTHDLVEHCAKALNPQAATLDPALKQHLGVGNATGLGMAPFLVHHPELLHNWVQARETALALALAEDKALAPGLVSRMAAHLGQWNVADTQGQQAIETTRNELAQFGADTAQAAWAWADDKSVMTQELVAALVIENSDQDFTDLCDQMSHAPRPQPVSLTDSTVDWLTNLLDQHFAWAFESPCQNHWFWYVSENKLEPRVGNRLTEDGAALERPLGVQRDLQALREELQGAASELSLADFLAQHPQRIGLVQRVLATHQLAYAEIQENLLGQQMRPIDMLRFKLSFFGAAKFDPKSDLWTRITLFQGAPTRHDLGAPGDDWWLAAV